LRFVQVGTPRLLQHPSSGPLQSMRQVPQRPFAVLDAHTPLQQPSPTPQTCPITPQLLTSLVMSTHWPLEAVVPAGHGWHRQLASNRGWSGGQTMAGQTHAPLAPRT
jgi:hypothetical protein